jgi:nitrate reductase NapE component
MLLRRRSRRKLLVWALVLAAVFVVGVAIASAWGGVCWMWQVNGGCFLM